MENSHQTPPNIAQESAQEPPKAPLKKSRKRAAPKTGTEQKPRKMSASARVRDAEEELQRAQQDRDRYRESGYFFVGATIHSIQEKAGLLFDQAMQSINELPDLDPKIKDEKIASAGMEYHQSLRNDFKRVLDKGGSNEDIGDMLQMALDYDEHPNTTTQYAKSAFSQVMEERKNQFSTEVKVSPNIPNQPTAHENTFSHTPSLSINTLLMGVETHVMNTIASKLPVSQDPSLDANQNVNPSTKKVSSISFIIDENPTTSSPSNSATQPSHPQQNAPHPQASHEDPRGKVTSPPRSPNRQQPLDLGRK